MSDEEAQLIRRVRAGDADSATELVDRHYQAIYGFLRRLSGSEWDAADLTQRTFSRGWSALGRFEGRSTVRSWLHGIARHVWLDSLKQNRRETARSDAWWEAQLDERSRPDEEAARSDAASSVYAAVDQLSEELRLTVHLHYYQSLSLSETAASLAVATSTVKHRLRTAVKQLRKSLGETRPSRVAGSMEV